MIFNMTGSMALNFSVKAYESELLIPETARENTIAVITSTPITSYIFSSEQPTENSDGMLWIYTSTMSQAPFSATDRNPIMIYPVSAMQYIGGEWVRVDAKVFQAGSWVDLAVFLYNRGDLCKTITGGYSAFGTNFGQSTIKVAPTVTYGETSVTVQSQSKEGGGVWVSVQKIDVSDYTSLCMKGVLEAYRGSGSSACGLCLWSAISGSSNWTDPWPTSIILNPWDGESRTESKIDPVIDVTNLTGSYYIGIGVYSSKSTNYGRAVIEKLWLE